MPPLLCRLLFAALVAAVWAPVAWSQPAAWTASEAPPADLRLHPEAGTERPGGRSPTPYYVRLDRSALSAAVAEAQRDGTPALSFAVAPDVRVQSEPVWTERRGADGLTWSGTVEGDPMGHVLITVEGEAATGHIATNGRSYSIGYAGGGRQAVYEVALDALGAPCHVVGGGAGHGGFGGAGRLEEQLGLRGASDTVRVMMLYTSDVRATLGGDGVAALLQGSIDSANDVLTRTEVPGRVAMVHAAEVPTLDPDLVEDARDALGALARWDDGELDEVHAWRLEHEAMLVSLIVELPGFCGAAYVPVVLSRRAVLRSGFNVVRRNCAINSFSFAHEVGHNLGLVHDPYANFGNGLYAFGHGYVSLAGAPGEQFRTVMAYSDECVENGAECPRVPYFSNPVLTLGRHPLGEPELSDAARVLSLSLPFAASLRLDEPVEAPDLQVVTREDEALELVPSRDAFRIRVMTPPVHGRADIRDDTVLVYRPASNYFGADSLIYEAGSEFGARYPGAIHIEVESVVDPPEASAVLAPSDDIDLNEVEDSVEVRWSELRHPDPLTGTTLEATWHLAAYYYEAAEFTTLAGDTTELRISVAELDAMLARVGVPAGRDQLVTHWVSVSDGERSTAGRQRHFTIRRLEQAGAPSEEEADEEPLPLATALRAVYPNPTRENLILEVGASSEGEARVTVYDVVGRPVRTLEAGLEAGLNRFQLDLRALPAGLYLYHVGVEGKAFRGRVTVL